MSTLGFQLDLRKSTFQKQGSCPPSEDDALGKTERDWHHEVPNPASTGLRQWFPAGDSFAPSCYTSGIVWAVTTNHCGAASIRWGGARGVAQHVPVHRIASQPIPQQRTIWSKMPIVLTLGKPGFRWSVSHLTGCENKAQQSLEEGNRVQNFYNILSFKSNTQ